MADYSVNMPPISHPPGPNSSDFRSSEPFSSSNNSRGGAYQENHTSGNSWKKSICPMLQELSKREDNASL